MTEPAILGIDRAIELLREVRDEFGGGQRYVKPAGMFCRYVHHDGEIGKPINGNAIPGCLIAQVLHRHGVSLETLNQVEGLDAQQLSDLHLCRNRGLTDILVTPMAGRMLVQAQRPQDRGAPWGVCVADAEDEYRKINMEKVG